MAEQDNKKSSEIGPIKLKIDGRLLKYPWISEDYEMLMRRAEKEINNKISLAKSKYRNQGKEIDTQDVLSSLVLNYLMKNYEYEASAKEMKTDIETLNQKIDSMLAEIDAKIED